LESRLDFGNETVARGDTRNGVPSYLFVLLTDRNLTPNENAF